MYKPGVMFQEVVRCTAHQAGFYMAKGSPSKAPLKLQCLRKWARPCLRDIVQLPKSFCFLFFCFKYQNYKNQFIETVFFFFPKQPPKQNDPPKSKRNKILSSVSLSSKMKAIHTQPCDWEARGLNYLVTTLAEGSRGAAVREPWSG